MFDTVWNWFNQYQVVWVSIGIISTLMMVISLFLMPWLVSLIPQNYFTQRRPDHQWPQLLRPRYIVRNVIGLLILLAGVAMLALPGQGVLTIMLGLGLMYFPGKYELERWLVRRPGIINAINWLRQRSHKPPLEL